MMMMIVTTEAAMVCGWMRVCTMVQHGTVPRMTTNYSQHLKTLPSHSLKSGASTECRSRHSLNVGQ